MRDYNQIVRRLEALAPGLFHVDELARLDGYPIHCVHVTRGNALPAVLLLGGTHGDEPAGVETCLSLLEQGLEPWTATFDFEILPCLNPFGYVCDRRHNAQDVDINWAYGDANVPEVQALRNLVRGRRFEFVLDFHEDWESPGYYLYELRRHEPVLGDAVIAAVSAVCPINMQPEIEGLPAVAGLIAPDPQQETDRRGAGIPLAMFFEHTDHLLTSESPTALDMPSRVAAHRAALQVVLQSHRERR